MPLIRRLPKRGFNNARHTVRYSPVNVNDLNLFDEGTRVDATLMRKEGLVNGPVLRIKILGKGELSKKLTVAVDAFSASARAKIEKLGGVCEVALSKKVPTKTA